MVPTCRSPVCDVVEALTVDAPVDYYVFKCVSNGFVVGMCAYECVFECVYLIVCMLCV